jgi:large repetitive protein
MNSPRIESVRFLKWYAVVFVFFFCLTLQSGAQAFTLNVKDHDGKPVNGFRWLVERDNTNQPKLNKVTSDSLGVNIFKSYAPVVAKGSSDTSFAEIDVNPNSRYFVSVLPNKRHSMGGAPVAPGQSVVKVVVAKHPIPTAQISVFVFHDNNLINNEPDVPPGAVGAEEPLEGFSILVLDQLGQTSQDAFANPLGTTYLQTCDANSQNPGAGADFCLDADGNPIVDVMGNGVILTDTSGVAIVKNLVPGKYGIRVVPSPDKANWVQTSTIEGTPGIDAWVKAREPLFLVEFGPTFYHTFFGFVEPNLDNTGLIPTVAVDPVTGDPIPLQIGSVTGQVVRFHSTRPPILLPTLGVPVKNCWIGVNDIMGYTTVGGLYTTQCNPADGTFTIPGLPAGTYQIVIWDTPLDYIFGFYTATIPNTGSPNVNVGQLGVNAWWGNIRGTVFNDINQNGFRDCVTADCNDPLLDEVGISDTVLNLRFRDGSIYQSTVTLPDGSYAFNEVFPFFKFLIHEVDFARFRASGATITVDDGAHPGDPPGIELNPQLQPDNGNLPYRTEIAGFSGEVLLEAHMVFADQTDVVDWGKKEYLSGENGGIAGIVHYATTRTEEDPAFAVADNWEPGIPRVQINLYESDGNGHIKDVNKNGIIEHADIDNHPFGNFPGPEDIDRNGNGVFDGGDAINIAHTDSWDDNKPTGCVWTAASPLPTINGKPIVDCAETLRTWNQVRPGVFDGGYLFHSYFPNGWRNNPSKEVEGLPSEAYYIVESIPPEGYATVKEEDQNIFTGDRYIPNLLPPPCVGKLHKVPQYLSIFPDEQIPAPFAGEMRPLCDRKEAYLADRQNNAVVDFYMFTQVPKAARAVGLLTNDLANTLDVNNVNFGEKQTPSWVPVAFLDFNGHEVNRVYTDTFGVYNALLPSTFTINPPIPTGVSPAMYQVCLNHPGPIKDSNNPALQIIDPQFNPHFSTTCLTLDFWPGKTTILDTPVIPVAAFTGASDTNLDCNEPDATPVIRSVNGPAGGPRSAQGATVTVRAVGKATVPNPDWDIHIPASPLNVVRDFGFGSKKGTVKIGDIDVNKANITWSADKISFIVPNNAETGQLTVTRGDNGRSTTTGITLTIGGPKPIRVKSGESIQDAIDSAPSGSLIIVEPGTYDENLIMWKNIKLQGSGAGSTFIRAFPFPAERVKAWRTKLESLTCIDINGNTIAACTPTVTVGDGIVPGEDATFRNEEAPGVMVLVKEGEFTALDKARIDGFTILGSGTAGAIFVNAYAHSLEISNNIMMANLGTFGGGIRIGSPSIVDPSCGATGYCSSFNDNISIHNNRISENGGINGGGGVNIYKGADNYVVSNNLICGNFSSRNGGGVAHIGLSNNGTIANNRIILNEAFYGTSIGGESGGILISGLPAPVGAPAGTLAEGSGSVTINANIIQGNLAGAGNGGGIRTYLVNGQDVQASPNDPTAWYFVNIFNNMIVDNVSGLAGGGIALKDTARVKIINNTIANNASAATALAAFQNGILLPSAPQGAGIFSDVHSQGLIAAMGTGIGPEFSDFSNPVLYNNILWHNSSFYFDPTINGGLGGLVVNATTPNWDLTVQGTVLPETMTPNNCILSDPSEFGVGVNNISADPTFVSGYLNTLRTVQVAQEGGNFVNVVFSPGDLTLKGDYRILPSSPAVDKGSDIYLGQFAELQTDFEGEVRPSGLASDIGADETSATFVAPGITVTNPDGTLRSWKLGTAHNITWTFTNDPGKRVKIELLKGDVFYTTIEDRTSIGSGGNGSFSWTISAKLPAGADYKIKVTSLSNEGYTDTSDNNFEIRE